MSVKDSAAPPVYARVALDIASRIARGEFREQSKIYGRSVMSSEYGVSPETIRRSLKLLADMDIVEIKQNSGAIVLSREHALAYVERFQEHEDVRGLHRKLKELVSKQEQDSRDMLALIENIMHTSEKFTKTNPFQTYETDVPSHSPRIGQSLGEMNFWQATGATIIAVRRPGKIVLSPGPYAELCAGDRLIFVGDVQCIDAVEQFLET